MVESDSLDQSVIEELQPKRQQCDHMNVLSKSPQMHNEPTFFSKFNSTDWVSGNVPCYSSLAAAEASSDSKCFLDFISLLNIEMKFIDNWTNLFLFLSNRSQITQPFKQKSKSRVPHSLEKLFTLAETLRQEPKTLAITTSRWLAWHFEIAKNARFSQQIQVGWSFQVTISWQSQSKSWIALSLAKCRRLSQTRLRAFEFKHLIKHKQTFPIISSLWWNNQ